MTFIRNLAVKIGLSERRKDGRVPARGLEVFYGTGLEQKRARVKDISPTGIYLLTRERWLPGTQVELTLQRKGLFDHHPRLQVRLQARAIRRGDDGVGLVFVHEHIGDAEWVTLMARTSTLFAQNDAVRAFRYTQALAFLRHIASAAEDRILKLITEEMAHDRVERAIEIALKAEEMLRSQHCSLGSGAPPSLVLRILVDGSKVQEEKVQLWYAGVLAACCRHNSDNEENLKFVDLLSKVDVVHVLILTYAGSGALRMGRKPGHAASQSLHCPADEMKKLTGKRDLAAIERDLNHLYELGLLELTVKAIPFAQIDEANLTLTSLGMHFFTFCNGNLEQPKAAEIPEATLEIAS